MKSWYAYLIVVPIVLLFLAQAFSTVIPGIVVPNKVTTGNTENTHPVADSNEIQGGAMQFAYSSELRTIPESRRRKGMLVYIRETDAYYQAYSTNGHFWKRWGGAAVDVSGKLDVQRFLNYSALGRGSATTDISGKLDVDRFLNYSAAGRVSPSDPRLTDARTPLAHTQEMSTVTGLLTALDLKLDGEVFALYTSTRGELTKGEKGERGFDGRHGTTLSCTILDGTRSLLYSAAGQLQTSSIAPLYAYLYLDGQLVTPLAYEWYIPATGTQLKYPPIRPDGMQARLQYFAFRGYSTYSTSRSNNYARVLLTYSSTRQPYGRRYCQASVPIAIDKQGSQGDQGIPGPAASVTLPAIEDAFSGTASDNPIVFQTLSGVRSKLEVLDRGSNTRMWVDTNGYQRFMDQSGALVVAIQSDGTIYMLNGAGKPRVKIANKGTLITTYASDGVTPMFELYSTGRGPWEPPAGNPAVDGYCWKSTAAGVRSWGSCGTGSGVAGANRQHQYNNNGAFAGTAYARYTTGGTAFSGTLVIR